MKRCNNKGFSMVELLAAVAILGILSALAIVGVGSILERAEKNHYKTQQKNLVLAAQSYAQDNRNVLPKEIGDTKTITLKELQSRKYIGDVVDRSKNACEEGSVTIFKYSKDGYSYRSYLKCDTKTLGTSPDEAAPGPEVTLATGGNYKNPYFTYAVETNSNGKIISYSYQIYNNTVLVRDSGSIAVSKAESLDEKKVSLKDLVPGNFTIVFQATNEYGGITTEKEEKEFTDPNGPICGQQSPVRNSWDNLSEITITVQCTPKEDGSECAREEFTQHFTDESDTGIITISNKNGNKTNCIVNTLTDRSAPDKPTIVATKGFPEGTWQNTPFTLTVTATDDKSGIAYYQYCYPGTDGTCEESEWTTYDESIRTGTEIEIGEYVFETPKIETESSEKIAIRALDQANNKSEPALFQINLDKTKPVVGTITENYDTGTSARNISTTLTDSGGSLVAAYAVTTTSSVPDDSDFEDIEDIASYSLVYDIPVTGGTYYVWAKDGAGNISEFNNISVEGVQFSITYNLNGGTAGSPSPTTGNAGTTITIADPTKSGWTFNGWTVSGEGSSISGTSLKVGTENIILTANWKTNLVSYIDYLYTDSSLRTNNGLKKDTTSDANIRYYTSEPKNYVKFNDELWRIVGVFNVSDGSVSSKRVKLIRSENLINDISWDSSDSSINAGWGIDEWSQADLQTILNSYYLGLSTSCKYCNAEGQASCNKDCSSIITPLSTTAINMIDNAVWYLGGIEYGGDDGAAITSVSNAYTRERNGRTSTPYCRSAYPNSPYCTSTDTVSRSSSFTGKVGLIYPSDYGYASSNATCHNDITYNTACASNNWMNPSSNYWTISHRHSNWFQNAAWQVGLTQLGDCGVCGSGVIGLRPSLYLKSSINITDGDGTSENPYILSAS